VWNPLLADSASFAMSALATAALVVIAPVWTDALRRRRGPTILATPFAVAAAAHVVTAPLAAGLSGQVSLVAIPANVLAEPVVAAVTVLGFAGAVVARGRSILRLHARGTAAVAQRHRRSAVARPTVFGAAGRPVSASNARAA